MFNSPELQNYRVKIIGNDLKACYCQLLKKKLINR